MSDASPYRFFAVDAATGERIGAPQRFSEDTRLLDEHKAPPITRTAWYLWQTDRPFPNETFLTCGYILCKELPCCDVPLEVRPTEFAQHVKLHSLTLRQYLRLHPSQLDLMPEYRIAP